MAVYWIERGPCMQGIQVPVPTRAADPQPEEKNFKNNNRKKGSLKVVNCNFRLLQFLIFFIIWEQTPPPPLFGIDGGSVSDPDPGV